MVQAIYDELEKYVDIYNNSDLHESFQSPPDKGDLGGWLCIGRV